MRSVGGGRAALERQNGHSTAGYGFAFRHDINRGPRQRDTRRGVRCDVNGEGREDGQHATNGGGTEETSSHDRHRKRETAPPPLTCEDDAVQSSTCCRGAPAAWLQISASWSPADGGAPRAPRAPDVRRRSTSALAKQAGRHQKEAGLGTSTTGVRETDGRASAVLRPGKFWWSDSACAADARNGRAPPPPS